MRLFYWHFRSSWGQAMVLFGGAGLVLLGIATYMTWQQTVELLRWPRVDAQVERAEVANLPDTFVTSYAARLWLAYRFNGREYRVQTDADLGLHGYADVAKAVLGANDAGHVTAMLDPQHPEVAQPRLATVWNLFLGPILIGSIGLVFTAFGVTFLVLGRRQGFTKPASATTHNPRLVWKACAGAGAICVIAGIVGGVLGPQGSSWIPAQAQVVSADVARVSGGGSGRGSSPDPLIPHFAVERWLTYTFAGRNYRTAVTGTPSTDADAVARWAIAEVVPRRIDVIVDPENPYRVMTTRPGQLDAILIPGVFGGIGVFFLGIGLLLRRQMPKLRSGAPPHRAQSAGAPSRNRN